MIEINSVEPNCTNNRDRYDAATLHVPVREKQLGLKSKSHIDWNSNTAACTDCTEYCHVVISGAMLYI